METTIVYWGYIGTVQGLYWDHIPLFVPDHQQVLKRSVSPAPKAQHGNPGLASTDVCDMRTHPLRTSAGRVVLWTCMDTAVSGVRALSCITGSSHG